MAIPLAFLLFACGGNSTSENAEASNEVSEEREDRTEEIFAGDLSASDIEKFIKTFPAIVKELDEVGEEIDERDQGAFTEVFKAPEVMSILEKYDWDSEEFLKKYAVIMNGYAYLKMEEQMSEMSEDEKKIMGGMMEQSVKAFRNFVNDDQLEVIKEHMDDLDPVFEEAGN